VKDDVAPTRRGPKKAARRRRPSLYEIIEYGSYEDWLNAQATPAVQAALWTALERQLSHAWERGGIHLSRAECWELLQFLRGNWKRPTQRGRRPDPEAEFKAKQIAAYSFLLEGDGTSTEAAVAKAMEVYGVSRPAVFAARKRWLPHFRGSVEAEVSPEQRRRRLRLFEETARFFRV
jgi:hypothetical protein